MTKRCIKFSVDPQVGDVVDSVGTISEVLGGPYFNAECDMECCNTGQCESKQIKYTVQSGSESTPDSTTCGSGYLPTPDVVTNYFYGSDAEFAATVPAVYVCPDPLPESWRCCTVYSSARSAVGCNIRYVYNDGDDSRGTVIIWSIDDTWPMGAI